LSSKLPGPDTGAAGVNGVADDDVPDAGESAADPGFAAPVIGDPEALAGIKVVDFSIWMFGPIATQVLGDFGAEIIKVEPPGGESGRGQGRNHPLHHGMSTRFLCRNRNKRSICLNLVETEGRSITDQLIADADVVVMNFRPGVAERLGLTYERLHGLNPRLIYVAGSGYGESGPYARRGGQDRAAQALSGFMAANGDPGSMPTGSRISIMDFAAGMVLTQGILVALLARERTGTGQRVDVSLLDAAINANTEGLTTYLNTGVMLRQTHEPLMRVYRTSDGYLQVVTVFARTVQPLAALCQALQRPDIAADPRYASWELILEHEAELTAALQEEFLTGTTAEWVQIMDERDIISAPVHDYSQVFEDPQVQHNQLLAHAKHPVVGDMDLVGQPIKLSNTPARIKFAPPLPGEHTDEILRELGYENARITALRQNGIIA
jgi:crotonobetainyl-CoA:carnitine CoA-transferase CaiB-like acyl-CoA transferase